MPEQIPTIPLELMEQAGCIFAGLDEGGCVAWINAFGKRLLGLASAKPADTPLIGGLVQDADNPEIDLAHLAHAILQEPAACSPSILVARDRENHPLRICWRFSRSPVSKNGSLSILVVGMPTGPFSPHGDHLAKGETSSDACAPSGQESIADPPFVLTFDQLQWVFEAGPHVCCIIDPKGRLLYVNDPMAAITGYTKAELQRLTLFDLRPPEHHAFIKGKMEWQFDLYQKVGTTVSVEYDVEGPTMTLIKKNGDHATLLPTPNIQILVDVSGHPAALLVSGTDITELATATEELSVNEARYRYFYEHAPVNNALIDFDGMILDVNENAAKFFGVKKELIVGKSSFDIAVPKGDKQRQQYSANREKAMAKIRTCLEQDPDAVTIEPDWPAYYTLVSPVLGERIFYRPTKYCIVRQKGRPIGYIVTFVDVTELEKTRRELAAHRDKLEELVEERTRALKAAQEDLVKQERLAALGHLTSTVSHELRNPLGTVSSSLYVIDKRTRGRVVGVEASLDRAQRNISRCDDIIEELLNYTREQAVTLEPTDLDAWLADFLDELAIPKDVILKRELAAQTQVHLDHEAFRRLMINLMDNALQSLVEDRPDRRVSVRTSCDETYTLIRIEDTGAGMDHERMSRVFEPLFSTKSFGVGLGLPIVRKIAREHGGEVAIESQPGEGTTAIVSIPRLLENWSKS